MWVIILYYIIITINTLTFKNILWPDLKDNYIDNYSDFDNLINIGIDATYVKGALRFSFVSRMIRLEVILCILNQFVSFCNTCLFNANLLFCERISSAIDIQPCTKGLKIPLFYWCTLVSVNLL